MDQQKKPRKADAMQVDWIVLIASAIGLAIVIVASIQAGENGLAANLIELVTVDQTEI